MENADVSGKNFMIESMITVFIVFIAIILVVGITQFFINRAKRVKDFGGEKYYAHKPNLLTKAESSFIKELYKIIPEHIMICPQVRMADVLVVSDKVKKKNFKSLFYKISSKSVDFVFCDKKTMEILFCMELDDPTHNRKDRIERDKLVNTAFYDAGMPLIRVPFSGSVNKIDYKKLETEIKASLS
jgi:hypothetical protein